MTHEEYYESRTDTNGCRTASMIGLILFIMFCIGLCTAYKSYGQSWSNENKGLYPNSVQVSINRPNESIGLIYSYLPQSPICGAPIGLYSEINSTIPKSWHSSQYYEYNNYEWQRKYSLGLSITLPHTFGDGIVHTMFTAGIVYNDHPRTIYDQNVNPGNFTGDYQHTTTFGCDIGIRMQCKHFTAHLKTDVVNFMRYTQFGCGYCFSFYKSQ